MKTKIAKAVLYPLFFLLCLVFFVIQGFPIDLVAARLTGAVERRLDVKLTTGSLTTLFPNGVEAQDVRMLRAAHDDQQALSLLVDRLQARVSLFGLLAGRQDVSFSGELLAGKLEGDVSLDPTRQKIEARLHSLDLGRLGFLEQALGLPLAGKVTGALELEIPAKDTKNTRGNVTLSLDGGRMGEGKVKGLTLPPIALGKTDATIEIAKGKADIKSFKVASDDIEASLEGYFLLQQSLAQASARCKLRFKPSEDFLTRNPKFRDLIALTGMEKARGQDGFFGYSVFGRLDALQFRAAKQ